MSEYKLFLEKLRTNIRLSDLISRSVKLRKHGNEYTGLCPFHQEKTPSFTVNDNKRFYHCFGCGAHGDIIQFIMETKKLEFKEAIEILAKEASLAIPEAHPNKQSSLTRDIIERIYLINQEASNWFRKCLSQANSSFVMNYVKSRGINNDSIKKFHLGYSNSNGQELKQFLLTKGYSEEELAQSGILAKTDKNVSYDRFRARIIFPIFDYKERVIAFGGRILQGTQAKYINSAESLIFNKSETLYGENLAKIPARENNRIILVEGYIDVIMMHQIGFRETVATLGTAATPHHLKKLWYISKNLIVFLDNDVAGKKAMIRIAELAIETIKAGYSISFTFSQIGKDPADLCTQATYQEIDTLLSQAIPLSELLWLEYKNSYITHNTPEEIAFLESNLESLLHKISDKNIRENFKFFFKDKIWNELRKKVKNKLILNNPKRNFNLLHIQDLSSRERLELNLLSLILNWPTLLKEEAIFEAFASFDFENEKLQKISSFIVEIFLNKTNYLEQDTLKEWILNSLKTNFPEEFLQNEALFVVDKMMLKTYEKSSSFFNIIILKIELIHLQKEYEDYLTEFTEASMDKAKLIFEEIKSLKEKVEKLELLNYD